VNIKIHKNYNWNQNLPFLLQDRHLAIYDICIVSILLGSYFIIVVLLCLIYRLKKDV